MAFTSDVLVERTRAGQRQSVKEQGVFINWIMSHCALVVDSEVLSETSANHVIHHCWLVVLVCFHITCTYCMCVHTHTHRHTHTQTHTYMHTHTHAHTHTHRHTHTCTHMHYCPCTLLFLSEYMCHVHVRSDSLSCVVIADHDYPSRVCFTLMNKVR